MLLATFQHPVVSLSIPLRGSHNNRRKGPHHTTAAAFSNEWMDEWNVVPPTGSQHHRRSAVCWMLRGFFFLFFNSYLFSIDDDDDDGIIIIPFVAALRTVLSLTRSVHTVDLCVCLRACVRERASGCVCVYIIFSAQRQHRVYATRLWYLCVYK